MIRVRVGGRVVKVAVMVATGVNAEDCREILRTRYREKRSAAGWLPFFRD